MIKAIMYDGLELGTFEQNGDKLELKLHDNVKRSWLPYIFQEALDNSIDMNVVLKAWIKERVFPKNRFGARKMLHELGLRKYDVNKIAETTRCSLGIDPYWLAYEDSDTYSQNTVRGKSDAEHGNCPYNSLGIKNEGEYKWRK